MSIDPSSPDAQKVRDKYPISRIASSHFEQLCSELSIEQLHSGEFLFKRGETTDELLYLLDGEISLQTDEFKIETLAADSESAKFAIAHQIPRKIDALSATDIRFLRLTPAMIKSVQCEKTYQEDTESMVVEETEGSNDWMTNLLKSPIFRALPPANLQKILMSVEEVVYKPDETIINQGESGDYYYMIKSGHCLITRKPTPTAKEVKLGELKTLDNFGEDSLLSGEPRNVTVRAITETSLLRLNKENFVNLIKKPALRFLTYAQAKEEMKKGAFLLDVRSQDEYEKNHLENSINAPFFSLRMHLKSMSKKKPVIVVCSNGKTSEAAAFLLLRNKIPAFILEGGMTENKGSAQGVGAKASFTIDDGIETINPLNITTAIKEESKLETDNETIESPAGESPQETIARLTQECRRLTAERDEWSKKYQTLKNQTEKLKALVESIRKNDAT
jgi:CRP-like cAMP-binding protein